MIYVILIMYIVEILGNFITKIIHSSEVNDLTVCFIFDIVINQSSRLNILY
jgi:hypothetical protein